MPGARFAFGKLYHLHYIINMRNMQQCEKEKNCAEQWRMLGFQPFAH